MIFMFVGYKLHANNIANLVVTTSKVTQIWLGQYT